jgi:hypothetical protein
MLLIFVFCTINKLNLLFGCGILLVVCLGVFLFCFYVVLGIEPMVSCVLYVCTLLLNYIPSPRPIYLFIYLGDTGGWTQGLALARVGTHATIWATRPAWGFSSYSISSANRDNLTSSFSICVPFFSSA